MSGRGVISIGAYCKPVTYTVQLRGELTIWVHDVTDDPRSRQALADALRRAAEMIEEDLATQE